MANQITVYSKYFCNLYLLYRCQLYLFLTYNHFEDNAINYIYSILFYIPKSNVSYWQRKIQFNICATNIISKTGLELSSNVLGSEQAFSAIPAEIGRLQGPCPRTPLFFPHLKISKRNQVPTPKPYSFSNSSFLYPYQLPTLFASMKYYDQAPRSLPPKRWDMCQLVFGVLRYIKTKINLIFIDSLFLQL